MPVSANIILWPKTPLEQVSAVAGLLQGATTPLHPRDVARAFKAKQASSMTPVLDTLTAIGKPEMRSARANHERHRNKAGNDHQWRRPPFQSGEKGNSDHCHIAP